MPEWLPQAIITCIGFALTFGMLRQKVVDVCQQIQKLESHLAERLNLQQASIRDLGLNKLEKDVFEAEIRRIDAETQRVRHDGKGVEQRVHVLETRR